MLVLVFTKNMQPVTLTLYLGYSLSLPFFIWLTSVLILGLVLGYMTASLRLRHKYALLTQQAMHEVEKKRASSENKEDVPRVASVAEAFKSVRTAPKGDDEHHHYGI